MLRTLQFLCDYSREYFHKRAKIVVKYSYCLRLNGGISRDNARTSTSEYSVQILENKITWIGEVKANRRLIV